MMEWDPPHWSPGAVDIGPAGVELCAGAEQGIYCLADQEQPVSNRFRGRRPSVDFLIAADPSEHRVVVGTQEFAPLIDPRPDVTLGHRFDLKAGAPQGVQIKVESPWLDEHPVSKRAVSLHPFAVVENRPIGRKARIASDYSLGKVINYPY